MCLGCSAQNDGGQSATAVRLSQIEAKVQQMELKLGLNHPQVPGSFPTCSSDSSVTLHPLQPACLRCMATAASFMILEASRIGA